ncbi:MAG: hypothetical protein P8L85_18745 [Rubripirellula sp.]|nr:hypothetical protein [Rubripirellula sp.]
MAASVGCIVLLAYLPLGFSEDETQRTGNPAAKQTGPRQTGSEQTGPESGESRQSEPQRTRIPGPEVDRSPVDLALSPSEKWLVTANQAAGTVSLIDTESSQVVDEIYCGGHLADLQFTPSGQHIVVTAAWSGELHLLEIDRGKLNYLAAIPIGMEPHGIAISADSKIAYVGLAAAAEVAEVDLEEKRVKRRLPVGKWPRYLTLSPDGSRLAVGNGGESNIEVLDVESGESLYREPLANGTNLGQMRTSPDGKYAYFTWMVYRTNPITVGNIRRGWILASRIGRVRLDGPSYREAISLDVPGMAVSDPHDLEFTPDGKRLVVTASGTHELLTYRLPDLPFVSQGGPGDLIDRGLQRDRERFDRIEVGGRPLGLKIAKDNRTAYVANYLKNAVQVVDLEAKNVIHEIELGGAKTLTLARRGMEIFYDGERSLDQWYSCHTCHQDGGTNARPMDTMNDGTEMTLKTVLPLYNVTKTFPWTWHGWQQNLTDAMDKSITVTMQGKPPSETDKRALIAYLATLRPPPNPHLATNGKLSAAALRGKKVFYSTKAGCADCHNGPLYSDGRIHDVGLGSDQDVYKGYNTPSLIGTYRKVRWLHSGRARDLERVVTDLHRPEVVNGEDELTEEQAADLIEFLKSL